MTDIMENEPSKILVFAETKRKVDELAQLLRKRGWENDIHIYVLV